MRQNRDEEGNGGDIGEEGGLFGGGPDQGPVGPEPNAPPPFKIVTPDEGAPEEPTSGGDRNSTTPRENFPGGGGGGNTTSTPKMPSVPTPQAGGQSTYGNSGNGGYSGPTSSIIPFKPLGSGPIGSPGAGSSSLFGGMGGLKGGGLGVPSVAYDPHGGGDTSSIDQLIAALTRKKGLF